MECTSTRCRVVEFDTKSDAQKAVRRLDGREMQGCEVLVREVLVLCSTPLPSHSLVTEAPPISVSSPLMSHSPETEATRSVCSPPGGEADLSFSLRSGNSREAEPAPHSTLLASTQHREAQGTLRRAQARQPRGGEEGKRGPQLSSSP